MTPTVRQRKFAYAAWIAVCLIWGTTYLGIRVSLETMPPALMPGLRYTLAGAMLLIVLKARGQRLPARSHWGGLALLGLLFIGVGNGGVVWAEQWVPSGLTAVILAVGPFWMNGVEALLPGGERFTRQGLVGLVVGFAGIVLLVWPDLRASGPAAGGFAAGVIALQIACLGWALGSSYSRRHAREENALGAAAYEMLFGGLILTALGTLTGEWRALHFTVRSASAFVYLIFVGAIGGFAAYVYALKHLPVSIVSLYAYINPIIAVALGVLLVDEPFDARMAVAAAIVFGGITIVRSQPRQPAGPAGREHRIPLSMGVRDSET